MERRAVIVFGARDGEVLCNTLLALNLRPMVCESVQGAVEKLRRLGCLAIVVDCEHARVDLLELALNVRDMDERIPIILAGRLPDPGLTKTIVSRPGTYLVEKNHLAGQLGELISTVAPNEEIHA